MLKYSSALNTKSLIEEISLRLEHIIATNQHLERQISNFDTKLTREVPIRDYLLRILKYTDIESSTLLYGIVLLKKFCAKASLKMDKKNIIKLLLISISISLKLHEDNIYPDKDMAKIGGISISNLILLEAEFLEVLEYKIAFLKI